ncbi:hypothetical protein NVV30_21475 [Pseudomonas syringae]|uniref:hypothetical protein n=1 Tax=Pseudomonas syringae TaxID=317 RepID=UPI00215A2310|nr:hypothetical protein [Pseudomonas syringae]MCR8721252.1 hypothetical protein [Pseudomonas syringae]
MSEAETKGWDKFSQTDWNDHRTFRRQWRQKLTSQHFKLTRYFGKDLADNLINLDRPKRLDNEIIDGNHVDGKKTYNIEQLASDVEFMTRLITLNQDIIDQSFNKQKANGAFEAMDEKRKNADTASKMLEQYNQGSVELIKKLESRLTQLGAASVKVVRINNDQ